MVSESTHHPFFFFTVNSIHRNVSVVHGLQDLLCIQGSIGFFSRSILKSAIHIDKEDILICTITNTGLFKVADACPTQPVCIARIIVEKTFRGFVVATKHNKMALIFTAFAKALLTDRKKTTVFNTARAEVTQEQNRIYQYDGHMSLGEMILQFLYCYTSFFYINTVSFGLGK